MRVDDPPSALRLRRGAPGRKGTIMWLWTLRSICCWRAAAVCVAALSTMGSGVWAASAQGLTPLGGGVAAPALVLKDVDGASHDLASYRGKVVLVNFWATWCEPCRHEMPSIQRLRDRFAGRPFVVLAVNVDEPDARVRRFLSETRLDVPVLMDPNKTVTRAWGVRVLPASFIVGPDGRTRYRLIGDLDWSTDAVVYTISELMDGR